MTVWNWMMFSVRDWYLWSMDRRIIFEEGYLIKNFKFCLIIYFLFFFIEICLSTCYSSECQTTNHEWHYVLKFALISVGIVDIHLCSGAGMALLSERLQCCNRKLLNVFLWSDFEATHALCSLTKEYLNPAKIFNNIKRCILNSKSLCC